MKLLVLLVGLVVSPHAFCDGSKWNAYIHESGWAVLSDTYKEGEYSLLDAVALVPKQFWLRHFRVLLTEKNSELQKEIHDYLASNYPVLHAEALHSSGNMHNPKIKALHIAFQDAILASSLAQRIDAALESRCERIASTSFEKFDIRHKDGVPIYGAMLWLSSEKCT